MVRLILAGIALVLVALVGFVGYRTMSFTAPPPPSDVAVPDTSAYVIDVPTAAAHLSEAIRFRTVSLVTPEEDRTPFTEFQAWMIATYPAFNAAARREMVNDLTVIYTWEGSDPAQPPLLLLAHQDVVPVPDDTRAAWSVDPFGGEIRDEAVWGRGAIDDKGSLVLLLEAAEYLAKQGKRPVRTIIFAFGHDEELGGEDGAVQVAALLAERGVRAWFVLDEGMAALSEHPLTGGPASMIGISERGFGTMRVHAVGQPGHSSMPPPETAVSLVSEAVVRIHDMPIEQRLEGGPALDMMRALAPEISLTNRMAVANEWLFGPLLRERMAQDRTARALMGTTVAPTMLNGGVRPNVLPAEATAMINYRFHPRDTAAEILERARGEVADLEGVDVDWADTPREATATSSTTSASYALLAALSTAVMPDAPVAPGLVLAGTDSRNYSEVAENVYRFQPMMFGADDLAGIHGTNEHLSFANLDRTIRFYIGLMEAGAMQ
ncbi:MAG: M20/M25/M40 family metallo-hydrolase [Hyphomonadaceae bacterium]|nr:M20/M25/M40 family metallo-hydrolase [Hyphomonadaceae bacterium]